jgi:cytochrome c biogenesis protein CcmG, thiol:disulfide interchange protein DsbE
MKTKYLLLIVLLTFAKPGFCQSHIDFTADDINGEEVVFSSMLENGPVMIAFWRSWCPSCKEEQNEMKELYEKYKPNGFQYLGINIDNQKSVSKVKAYVAAHNFTFTVILDTDKKIFELCGGNDDIMPYSLIIDKNGEVYSTHIGFKSGDEFLFEKKIKKILNIE